ncbi:MAG: gliding motility-associated C-terminal domain-containing protein [Bacteroidales bacterium]
MLKLFYYLLMCCIVLFNGLNLSAQMTMPDNVCVASTKYYNVNPNPVSGSTYIWRIDGITQISSVSNGIYITWASIASFLLDVQELSAEGCLGPVRSGQVFVSPVPSITANSNSPVCLGSSVYLNAQTLAGVTYLWTGPNGYLSNVQNSVISTATLLDAGIYSLTVSANGCNSVPYIVTVIVNNCLVDFFIPEGFSPNDDGINDLFVIRGIDNFPHNTFLIYNRWGNKVFEASPYQNNWDGKSDFGLLMSGDVLPTATYFYLLDLGIGSDVIKGTIYLNK